MSDCLFLIFQWLGRSRLIKSIKCPISNHKSIKCPILQTFPKYGIIPNKEKSSSYPLLLSLDDML